MKLKRIICLCSFLFLFVLAYPQTQENPKTTISKSQSQSQIKKDPPKEVKKVPKSSTLTNKQKTHLKNATQKQRMKKFIRKTNIKRKRSLKRR